VRISGAHDALESKVFASPGKSMPRSVLLSVALFAASLSAYAGDVLLAGHVQRVILQPSDTGDCPSPCAAEFAGQPNAAQRVCVSNGGGCQTMEVKVDQVYRGQAGRTRTFTARIGEWGPSFPLTRQRIVVGEDRGEVSWSFATDRDGRVFIDPKRMRRISGVTTSTNGNEDELVALDDILARADAMR
jgi:hypothetical protein